MYQHAFRINIVLVDHNNSWDVCMTLLFIDKTTRSLAILVANVVLKVNMACKEKYQQFLLEINIDVILSNAINSNNSIESSRPLLGIENLFTN